MKNPLKKFLKMKKNKFVTISKPSSDEYVTDAVVNNKKIKLLVIDEDIDLCFDLVESQIESDDPTIKVVNSLDDIPEGLREQFENVIKSMKEEMEDENSPHAQVQFLEKIYDRTVNNRSNVVTFEEYTKLMEINNQHNIIIASIVSELNKIRSDMKIFYITGMNSELIRSKAKDEVMLINNFVTSNYIYTMTEFLKEKNVVSNLEQSKVEDTE